jgi:predicted enzyme related to lactoylglutathione lyase
LSDNPPYRCAVVAPVLVVTDLTRAVAHYTDRLLFTTGFEWADSPTEPLRYAIVQNGDIELHLAAAPAPRPTVAYVFVDGIDAYHAAVAPLDPAITAALADQPWEMREFEITDPDGNRIIFGEHMSRIETRNGP